MSEGYRVSRQNGNPGLGTITDASGAAVPNAQITCTETNTGVNRKAVASDVGTYVFSGLPPGVYSVAVELAGFKKEVRSRVEVQVNQTARVDMTLQPGAVTETLTVTGEAGLLQTDRTDTNQKIETAALGELPISTPGGRNFQVLLNLVPGTSPAAFNHSQFFNDRRAAARHRPQWPPRAGSVSKLRPDSQTT